jgi:hypothetical protein
MKNALTEKLLPLFGVFLLTLLAAVSVTAQKSLETRQIDLKGCIQTIFNKQFVISNEKTFWETVRNDASRNWCRKNLKQIDFSKHTLLGIEINSGYCWTPLGLEFQTVKDQSKKQYLVNISSIKPDGVCRALSQYDLWLLVPKLSEDYDMKFEIAARTSEKK